MKRNFVFLLIIVGLLAAFSCKEYENIEIADLPLDSAQTGIYTGEYNTTLVKVKVKVQIEDYSIKNIEILKHQCGRGKEAEKITDDVIEAQSLQVDAITGATYSSKVILKAIEKAIQKSLNSKQSGGQLQ